MSETPAEVESQKTPIVALGASAGGLRPLELFFGGMPEDTGAAFVVIQHLSPDFESMMDHLLSRRTTMTVVQATEGMKVEPNHVYLIPRRADIRLADGVLRVTQRTGEAELNLPIDIFFRSMADAQGSRCIAVLLSGAGSDGSVGIRAVRAAGGMVAVQAPESAQFDLMPKSAIATGEVDEVLDPEQLPDWVREQIALIGERVMLEVGEDLFDPEALNRIARLLRQRHRIDFTAYKRLTLVRRIQRRMGETGCRTVEEYGARLSLDEHELDRLFRDLLIGVSAFFRDEEAFAVLWEKTIPQLFDGRESDSPVRCWVAGCSTGEEAYSIGMYLHEAAHARGFPVDNVKVFATDVHPDYLARASRGAYSRQDAAAIPDKLRERYFAPNENGDGYVVRTSLRSSIVFARHDLLHDPPFTRIDLVTCRNVLIYLRARAQQRVLDRLMSSLVPGGWLFLGPSETVGPLERLLDVINRRERIFRARGGVLRPFTPDPADDPVGIFAARKAPWTSPMDGTQRLQFVYQQVLDRFVPACVLLDATMRVVHVFGDAARFLELGPGRAGLDVMRIIRTPLRGALAAALHRCRELGEPVLHRAVPTGDDEKPFIDLRVEQLSAPEGQSRRYTVAGFIEAIRPATEVETPVTGDLIESQLLVDLRSELDFTREHLSATTEELTASNEELQATNEELVAANEELQSTNEELQSTNEELYTVNSEFRRKNTELSQLNIDVDNLLRSSDLGAIFVDADLRVRKFTPAAGRLLHLMPQDIGRPLAHLASAFRDTDLVERIKDVLSTGEEWSEEWALDDGRLMLLRCMPNRDEGDSFDGVVTTFVDATSVAEARTAQAESERRLRIFADHMPFVLWLADAERGRYRFVSRAFEKIWGRPAGDLDTLAERTTRWVHPDDRPLFADHLERMAVGQIAAIEYRVVRPDGRQVWLRSRSFPITNEGDAWTLGGLTEDITEAREHADVVHNLQIEKDRLASLRDAVLESTDDGIAMFDRSGLLVFANRAFAELVGIAVEASPHYESVLPEAGGLRRAVTDAMSQNHPQRGQSRARFDGGTGTYAYTVKPVRDARWRASHVVLILRDTGEGHLLAPPARYTRLRLAAEEVHRTAEQAGQRAPAELRDALERLRHTLDHTGELGDGPVDLTALSWAVESAVERGLPATARFISLVTRPEVIADLPGEDARQLVTSLVEHTLADQRAHRLSRLRLAVGVAVPPADIERMSRPAFAGDGGPMAYIEIADDGAGHDRGFIKGLLRGEGGRGDARFDEAVALVEPHGGAVELRSLLGSGTTRRVWLALRADAAVDLDAGPAPSLVLVADDAPEIRAAIVGEVGDRFSVDEAGDGLATLRRFRTAASAVAAVVLDIEMPGPSARAVFRELRALDPRVPIVLLSAYPDDVEDAGITLDDRCTTLMKPWTAGALRAAIDGLAGRREPEPPQPEETL